MRTACEVMVKFVLPAFRSLVARRLAANYGLSQVDIAKLLGITQPTISFYLSSKRGRWMELLENNPKISELADAFAAALVQGGKSEEELNAMICQLCMTFRELPEYKNIGYVFARKRAALSVEYVS